MKPFSFLTSGLLTLTFALVYAQRSGDGEDYGDYYNPSPRFGLQGSQRQRGVNGSGRQVQNFEDYYNYPQTRGVGSDSDSYEYSSGYSYEDEDGLQQSTTTKKPLKKSKTIKSKTGNNIREKIDEELNFEYDDSSNLNRQKDPKASKKSTDKSKNKKVAIKTTEGRVPKAVQKKSKKSTSKDTPQSAVRSSKHSETLKRQTLQIPGRFKDSRGLSGNRNAGRTENDRARRQSSEDGEGQAQGQDDEGQGQGQNEEGQGQGQNEEGRGQGQNEEGQGQGQNEQGQDEYADEEYTNDDQQQRGGESSSSYEEY